MVATSSAAAFASAIPLPPRERQTLTMLLRGLPEKRIAEALSISRHTVHVYVRQLYRRFNVGSRAELLARWIGTSHAGAVAPEPSLDDLIRERNDLAARLAALDQRVAAKREDVRRFQRMLDLRAPGDEPGAGA
jgi:DNA-binding CsgD family transcriptional regulator